MMNMSLHRMVVFCLVIFASSVIMGGQPLPAQDAEVTMMSGASGDLGFNDIKTLGDLRQLDSFVMLSFTENFGNGLRSKALKSRDAALQKVKESRAMLADAGDREKVKKTLQKALQDYFLADMRYRVQELDAIKAKVAETEANLEKRLKAKDESVELQFKLMLQEADGVSVFGPPKPDPSEEYMEDYPRDMFEN